MKASCGASISSVRRWSGCSHSDARKISALACDFLPLRRTIFVRVSNGMESFQGTDWGPGVDPRPAVNRPGKFHPGGKEEIDDDLRYHHLNPDQDHQGFAYSSSQTEVGVSWAAFTRPQPRLQYTLLLF